MIDKVISIFAGTNGFLDSVPITQVAEWEKQMIAFIHEKKEELWKTLDERRDVDDDLIEQIKAALTEFKEVYKAPTK